MSRKLLFALLASAAFAAKAAGQATGAPTSLADQIGPLIETARASEAKAPTLKKEADDLLAANQSRKKEYDLYPPQLQRIDQQRQSLFAPIKAAAEQYKPDRDAYSAQVDQFAAELAPYNSACASRQLSTGEYQNCLAWKSRLDHRKANLDTVKAGLDNRYARINADIAAFRVQEAALLKQRGTIERRIEEIAAEMRRNFAAWEAKSAELRAMQARIDRINTLCGIADRRCAQNERDGCEALKHCHSIDWDGARTNLRPLGPLQRGPLATPNQ